MRTVRRGTLLLIVSVMAGACSVQAPQPSEAHPTPTATPTPAATLTSEPVPTAGAFEASLVAGLRTETDVRYMHAVPCGATECAVPLDVLAPEDGEGLPAIVLVPGGRPSST